MFDDVNEKIEDPYLNGGRVIERLMKEYKEYGQLIIGYDYDYTLNSLRGEKWTYPKVEELLKRWEGRAKFVCCTSSPKKRHGEIREDLKKRGIPLDAINEDVVDFPFSGGKVFNNILLDDRAGLMECYTTLSLLLDRIEEEEEELNRIRAVRKNIRDIYKVDMNGFMGEVVPITSFAKELERVENTLGLKDELIDVYNLCPDVSEGDVLLLSSHTTTKQLNLEETISELVAGSFQAIAKGMLKRDYGIKIDDKAYVNMGDVYIFKRVEEVPYISGDDTTLVMAIPYEYIKKER